MSLPEVEVKGFGHVQCRRFKAAYLVCASFHNIKFDVVEKTTF